MSSGFRHVRLRKQVQGARRYTLLVVEVRSGIWNGREVVRDVRRSVQQRGWRYGRNTIERVRVVRLRVGCV